MKRTKLLVFALVILVAGIGACKKNKKDADSSSCDTVCSKPLDNGQTAGTTPATIVGEYTLTYHKSSSGGGPFTDGQQVNFELTNDNNLKVSTASECVTITNPRASGQVEVIFPDNCKFNVSFAASASVKGGLNEINVNALTGQFYGQFR